MTRAFPTLPAGHVVYVVGDIHGRRDLLENILWHIDLDRRQHGSQSTEIYLGDYVDRGPELAAVIATLIERAKNNALICLRGNHEALFEDFLAEKMDLRQWSRLGGLETLHSYGLASGLLEGPREMTGAQIRSRIPPDHLAFLGSLRNSFEIHGYFFTHAGILPGVPLPEQTPSNLRTIRGAFLNDDRDHGAVIVHGHTPCEEPEVFLNRINIDTGAYMTGRLTCLVIDHRGPQFLHNRS